MTSSEDKTIEPDDVDTSTPSGSLSADPGERDADAPPVEPSASPTPEHSAASSCPQDVTSPVGALPDARPVDAPHDDPDEEDDEDDEEDELARGDERLAPARALMAAGDNREARRALHAFAFEGLDEDDAKALRAERDALLVRLRPDPIALFVASLSFIIFAIIATLAFGRLP